MIQTYGVSSIGIDGLEFLGYHVGSHYYLAHLSKIFGQTAWFGYSFYFIIVIIPLFIYLYLSTIRSIVERFDSTQIFNFIFWIVFIVVTFSILSDWSKFGKDVFLFQVISESYAFAFSILCLFIIFFIELNEEIILEAKKLFLFFCISLIVVFFTTLLKISVGFLFCVAISYFFFKLFLINKTIYIRIKIVISILILVIVFFAFYKFVFSNKDTINFSLFFFIKYYTSYIPQKAYFYFIHFFWGIAYCILRIRDSKIYTLKSSLKNDRFVLLDVELLIVIMIVSSLPGLLIKISGGSAIYFSIVARQLGMILFLAYTVLHQEQLQHIFRKYVFIKNDISFGLIFSCFMTMTIFGGIAWKLQEDLPHTYMIHKNLANEYNQLKTPQMTFANSSGINRNWATYITNELDSLAHLPIKEKRKLAIHISQSDTSYWKYMNTKKSLKSISFVVPAISGIMQIDGMPICGQEVEDHGFVVYRGRKNYSTGHELNF